MKTVTKSSETIKNIINNENYSIHHKFDVGVYAIQCLDCNKAIWVKYPVMFKKECLHKHNTLMKGNENNAIVRHNLEVIKDFNFRDSKMLVYIQDKHTGRLLNLASFLKTTLFKQGSGFFNSSSYSIKLVLKCYNISYLK